MSWMNKINEVFGLEIKKVAPVKRVIRKWQFRLFGEQLIYLIVATHLNGRSPLWRGPKDFLVTTTPRSVY